MQRHKSRRHVNAANARWRAVDADTGEVLHCAALKELLRWIAGQVPRMLAARNWH